MNLQAIITTIVAGGGIGAMLTFFLNRKRHSEDYKIEAINEWKKIADYNEKRFKELSDRVKELEIALHECLGAAD